MTPEHVRSAAALDRRPLPPVVEAARREIASGKPTRGAIYQASLFAQVDSRAGVGGRIVGRWLAEASLKAVPPEDRTGKYDTWILEALAGDMRANLGETRPTFLTTLSKRFTTLEDRANTEIRTALKVALRVLARQAGLKVMSSKIGDPTLRASLRDHPLENVPAVALKAMGRKSFMAVTAQQVNEAIERALTDLTVSVRNILETYYKNLKDLIAETLQTDPPTDITAAINAAVERALDLFSRIAEKRIRPETVETEPEGRNISVDIFAGIATLILSEVENLGPRLLSETIPLTNVAALTVGVAAVIAALQARPETLTRVTVWRHAYYGRGATDFDPHKRLDGKTVNTESWTQLVTAPLKYTRKDGLAVSRRPFADGRWFPGDHEGCTCRYETSLVVRL